MDTFIYDKTDKGREEIATRKYRIAPRMRSLLVMVDGRRPLDTLLKNIAGLGLDEDSVSALLAQDFIRMVPVAAPEPPSEPAPPAAPVAAKPAPEYGGLYDVYKPAGAGR